MNVEAFSKGQILALLSAARARRHEHWLLICTAYLHGLRASEVIQIKASDVRDGYLVVAREKGSERTVQPLLASDNPLLNEAPALIEKALNTPAYRSLFNLTRQTVFNLVQRYGKAAGLPSQMCHPHNLKHSCGTHMYEETKSLPIVQKWLGHRSGTSTLVYLNTTQGEANRAAQKSLCV